jgi:hypothetical protein
MLIFVRMRCFKASFSLGKYDVKKIEKKRRKINGG